jgi:c-di-AMP phosphodiesterase-like protein
MSGIFSIASAVKIMEEFRIYKDDLTETHISLLQSIIEKNIKKYKTVRNRKFEEYKMYRGVDYGLPLKINTIENLTSDKKAIMDIFNEEYGIKTDRDELPVVVRMYF